MQVSVFMAKEVLEGECHFIRAWKIFLRSHMDFIGLKRTHNGGGWEREEKWVEGHVDGHKGLEYSFVSSKSPKEG